MARFDRGFFKVWRSLLSSDIGKNPDRLALITHLIGMANLEDSWVERGSGPQKIERGSLVTSIKELCQRTGLSERKIRTQIEYFRMRRTIDIQTDKRGTLITISNFSKYQDPVHVSDIQTDKQTTNRRQCIKELRIKEGNYNLLDYNQTTSLENTNTNTNLLPNTDILPFHRLEKLNIKGIQSSTRDFERRFQITQHDIETLDQMEYLLNQVFEGFTPPIFKNQARLLKIIDAYGDLDHFKNDLEGIVNRAKEKISDPEKIKSYLVTAIMKAADLEGA